MRRWVLLRVVAVLEIIGGLLGPIGVVAELMRGAFTADRVTCAAVGIALFLLSLFAGVMLWRDRPAGYFASVVVQSAQLVKVATPKFAFIICLGGDLSVMWVTHQDANGKLVRGMTFHSQGGAHAVIELNRPPGAPQVFGISLVSCVALVLLRNGQSAMADGNPPPGDAASAAMSAGGVDSQPNWVLPFWLKIVVGLLILVVISCAGLLILSTGP